MLVSGHKNDMKTYSVLTIVFAVTMSVFGDHEDRPKLVSHGGNLFIVAAQDKNITFKTDGSRSFINVDGENLIDVLKAAENASHTLKMLSSTVLVTNQPNEGFTLLNNMINGPRGINRRLSSLDSAVFQETPNTFRNHYPLRFRYGVYSLPNLRRRLTDLERKMNSLNNMLTRNKCDSNPCSHGGTCQDLFNGFLCVCSKTWEGPQCEVDVNECASFAGTDLGCQNGATCTNEPGSYKCACAPGWFGVHCTRLKFDCAQGSAEICGHGMCLPQQSGSGIKCLCDQGWKSDGDDKPCLIDVDECTEKPQCSPLVTCINLPGTFYCSPCPKGYTGNGYHCVDLDECQVDNGGCSVNPTVQCTNTPGSRTCGPCPVGYQGDGTVCVFRGTCQINNGGCYPGAVCIENSALGTSFVQCICPNGFIGNGMGLGGCIPGVPALTPAWMTASQCTPNTCVHGICHNIPTGYVCICHLNYSGQGCGGIINAQEGTVYSPLYPSTYRSVKTCEWIITTSSGSLLNLNFDAFDLGSRLTCNKNYLEIFDRDGFSARHYCGDDYPALYTSRDNYVKLVYHTALNNGGIGWYATFNSTRIASRGL